MLKGTTVDLVERTGSRIVSQCVKDYMGKLKLWKAHVLQHFFRIFISFYHIKVSVWRWLWGTLYAVTVMEAKLFKTLLYCYYFQFLRFFLVKALGKM